MKTIHKRVAAKRLLATAAASAVLLGIGTAYASDAHAAQGCQSQPWGFMGSQTRIICDEPIRRDGTWMRTRAIVWPSRWVPLRCNYSCWGGYWTEPGGSKETYPVTADTVLPDEPGHLEAV
ncbi:hypothetical protein E3G52_000395 [Mycobacteroides abscessus]|uniref:CDGP domain-containing protein n=1 Tax=Mycobacteroides abscessus TaxID=36809 RepID=UPI001877E668|nr:hypothetical protein [Mycobacteroides abscessus]MBE5453531.1 hypothetical protein [Mycobacteroides abscessus]